MSTDVSASRMSNVVSNSMNVTEPVSSGKTMLPQKKMISRINSMDDLKTAERQGVDVPISEQQLIKSISQAIKKMEGAQTTLNFSVHKATHQIMVKVLDKETGEIIREIPPEKTLDFVAHLWRMAGILIDEKK